MKQNVKAKLCTGLDWYQMGVRTIQRCSQMQLQERVIDGRAIYLWLRLLITGVPLRFLHIQPSCHTKPSLSLQFSYFGILLSYFHTLVILLPHKTMPFPPIFILWHTLVIFSYSCHTLVTQNYLFPSNFHTLAPFTEISLQMHGNQKQRPSNDNSLLI